MAVSLKWTITSWSWRCAI